MFTYKSNSCEKKGKKWVHRKAENFLRKQKNGDAQKKKIATIDGPHYSPMKKKWAHKKNSVTDVRGKKEVVKKYSSVWAHLKVNGPKFGMIIKMVFVAKMVKKKAHSLFPENYLTPIFTCPMVT